MERIIIFIILALCIWNVTQSAHADCQIQTSKQGAQLLRNEFATARYDQRTGKLGMQMMGTMGSREFVHVTPTQAGEAVAVKGYLNGLQGKRLSAVTIKTKEFWLLSYRGYDSADDSRYMIAYSNGQMQCGEGDGSGIEAVRSFLSQQLSALRSVSIEIADPQAVWQQLGL